MGRLGRKRTTPIYFPRAHASGTFRPYGPERALTIVSPSEESTVDPSYDLYVCNPTIATATLQGNVGGGKIRLAYATSALIFQDPGTPSQYWQGLIAETTGTDYWHTDGDPDSESNRLSPAGAELTHWYVRPSASLGARLAAYVVDNLPDYFDGVYSDETQGEVPNSYWNAWKTADDGPTDAERPAYDILWKDMQSAWLYGLKNIWQNDKALVANSAGAVYPNVDGITIERTHIQSMGEAWALERFLAQSQLCDRFAYRYRSNRGVLNVSWTYPIQIPGFVMLGKITGT